MTAVRWDIDIRGQLYIRGLRKKKEDAGHWDVMVYI